jgi:ataxia telangiectasia mutated family protein
MEAWHTARTAYTRSCAVNSIVGHILGIGDRHLSNILVNTKTGEVVHIDFGFVFEQGKALKVPELVPFRLTRDIVDGMGPSGTDGVFFKAAEETLTVLRNNSDTLLTILSAVVSDPLYKWSISPQKASELQQQQESKEEEEEEDDGGEAKSKEGTLSSRPSLAPFNAENKSDHAARAISKITNKLQGYEDSSAFDKSVAGQVKLLINEARDPDNLGLMFSGWKPWL